MSNPASDLYSIHLVQSYSDYMPRSHFTAAPVTKIEGSKHLQSPARHYSQKKNTKPRNELSTHPTLHALPCFRYYRRRNPQAVYQ